MWRSCHQPPLEGSYVGVGCSSKAVEDNRTPSPGGIAEGLGENEHRWGVRRWLREFRKQRAEIRGQTTPESRCDFVLHETDAEELA